MDPTQPTILVVEDNRATRTFLADNLTADGYDLLEAATASEGAALLAGGFPDLAIIDLGLPDGDGLDLLRQVRECDRVAGKIDPELPLLVLSGRAGEVDRLRGFDRGCDDYLVKPFSYQELRGAMVHFRWFLSRTARWTGRMASLRTLSPRFEGGPGSQPVVVSRPGAGEGGQREP